MLRRVVKSRLFQKRLPFGWLLAGSLLATAALASGGCNSLDVRGDSFPTDETFQWSGRVRPADKDLESFGFSNKARQIEKDCGVR